MWKLPLGSRAAKNRAARGRPATTPLCLARIWASSVQRGSMRVFVVMSELARSSRRADLTIWRTAWEFQSMPYHNKLALFLHEDKGQISDALTRIGDLADVVACLHRLSRKVAAIPADGRRVCLFGLAPYRASAAIKDRHFRGFGIKFKAGIAIAPKRLRILCWAVIHGRPL